MKMMVRSAVGAFILLLMGGSNEHSVATPKILLAQAAAPASTAPDTPRFAFQRLDVDQSGLQPRVCVQFTQALRAQGVRYLDYVAVSPQARPAASVDGNRLCLTGLAYGTDYEIDLRPGLPSAGDQTLAAGERIPVTLTARPAVVTFSGGGRILVRGASDGLPVTTVNVPEVALRVFRVGERGFAAIRDEFKQNERRAYPYAFDRMRDETGTLVWSGTLATENPPNREVTTLFPIAEVVRERKPGVYWVVAFDATRAASDDEESRWSRQLAAQWVISTDMGLSVVKGADGLTVFARNFADAKPMADIELRLIARNNEELGRARTDATGRASFAPGLLRGGAAATPVSVMAFGPGEDFTIVDLDRPAFDLSDRGVEGRAPPGPVDVFAWTERGIYRPGEQVAFTALLRDAAGSAAPNLPVQIALRRPNGTEARRFALTADAGGALHQTIAITPTAARGLWSAEILVDPTAPAIGRARFEVEDFVPQKLKVELAPKAPAYAAGEEVQIDVNARFLYGAPASDLATEAEATIEFDPEPYPQLRGFLFGHEREKAEFPEFPLAIANTDAQGKAVAAGKVPDLGAITRPLRAVARVAVFEPGGRSTADSVTLRLKGAPVQLGLKPLFTTARSWWDDSERLTVPWDSTARFELVAVDAEGRRIAAPNVEWQLIREEVLWNWVRSRESWRFEEVVRERVVGSGRGSVEAERFAEIAADVTWGRHRLVVRVPGNERAQASLRFHAGWGGSDVDKTPDKLDVLADKQAYRVGETARLRIDASYAGEATILVATDRIHAVHNLSVPAGGSSVDIPVDAAWGPGAYALVSLIRPLEPQSRTRAPVRAVGLAWLGIDNAARKLAVEIDAPQIARPRGATDVTLRVPGAGAGTRVTLAAVDEGILQLTRYRTPDPHAHVFGKRRLGLELRDDYGRLIDGRGTRGAVRQGGDAGLGGKGLDVVPITIVSLFHGPLTLDAEGRAKVTLDIPDFVGELRLMAVAWDGERVGNGESRMTVRDPLVADATFPRFLAPGDESRVNLWLHNVEGVAGIYRATWSTQGQVRITGNATQAISLPGNARQLLSWPLTAGEIGITGFTLNVNGPGGFAMTREWKMEVRPAQAPVTEARIEKISPGATLAITPRQLASYVPGSVKASLEVASWRGFDVPALLRSLDRYPFGCLEQTTSRAFPLLFLNEAAALIGAREDRAIERRIQDAIWRVLDMQRPDGGFGLWGPTDDHALAWLQVYTIDFLLNAKKRDLVVPDEALSRAVRWLRTTSARLDGGDEARAYALFVLAREGRADLGTMRYVHDARAAAYENPLMLAQLGAALQLGGDVARADNMFARSLAALDRNLQRNDRRSFDYYGSPLRDLAGTVAAAAASNRSGTLDQLFRRFGDTLRLPQVDATTTQEKSWMLLATHALTERGSQINIDADGQTILGRARAVFDLQPQQMQRGFQVANRGERDVWATSTVTGVPRAPLPAANRRYTIARSYFTLTGEKADLTKLRQNDRVVVWIEVGGFNAADRQVNADVAITNRPPRRGGQAAKRPGGESNLCRGEQVDEPFRCTSR
jgi:alpha-2-macroglobulin